MFIPYVQEATGMVEGKYRCGIYKQNSHTKFLMIKKIPFLTWIIYWMGLTVDLNLHKSNKLECIATATVQNEKQTVKRLKNIKEAELQWTLVQPHFTWVSIREEKEGIKEKNGQNLPNLMKL